MKKLGFGLMRLPLKDPENKGDIDLEELKRMVDRFIEEGFTYFDTAWMYCAFQSEPSIKKALTSRYPREAYTLADKLHSNFFDSLEGRDEIFEKQLENTGVDYFDYYLLHAVDDQNIEKYEKLDCFAWLQDKKDRGLVKNTGFSFHGSPELLERLLNEHPEVDFVQLQINYLDWDSDTVQSGRCHEIVRNHGKKVMVMEPVKGGTLASLPPKAQAILEDLNPDASAASFAIRYAAGLDNVEVVLSGMSNLEQMNDNLSFMKDFTKLCDQELKAVKQCADEIRSLISIDCTGCSYCTEGCPQHIAIPQYFSLYNEDMAIHSNRGWKISQEGFKEIASQNGLPSDCIQCGQCEDACPQHLPIVEDLKKIAEVYEE